MRDLTKLEREWFQILADQISDERPMRIMCDLADRFLALMNGYNKRGKIIEELSEENERLKKLLERRQK